MADKKTGEFLKMALPPRSIYPLPEVAARWSCTPADLAEWALKGHFRLMTSVSIVHLQGEPFAGKIELHAADMMTMFRRDGSGPEEVYVHRARPSGHEEFSFLTRPEDGLIVERADIFITAEDVRKFEETHELVRRAPSGTSTTKYDWDPMYVAVVKRLHEHGLPETQAEFIGEFQEWFARRDPNGEAPDERTIRRRINPIWRALREVA